METRRRVTLMPRHPHYVAMPDPRHNNRPRLRRRRQSALRWGKIATGQSAGSIRQYVVQFERLTGGGKPLVAGGGTLMPPLIERQPQQCKQFANLILCGEMR